MSSDFLRSALKAIIILAIGITIVNDAGAIAMGHYRADDEAKRVAEAAQAQFKMFETKGKALAGAEAAANQDGVILTGFEVTSREVRVAVEIPPRTTWVAQRVASLKPYLSASGQASIQLR